MNTKGIKFLAVLAVLAMAFAVFATIAPAESDDAATTTEVTTFAELQSAIDESATDITVTASFHVTADITIPETTTVTIQDGVTTTVDATFAITVVGTLVNDGTIATESAAGIVINGTSAIITASSSSAKGAINGSATLEQDIVVVTQGTLENQTITQTAMTDDTITTYGATGGAIIKDLEIVEVANGHGIQIASAYAVDISNVTFTSATAVETENLIYMGGAVGATISVENITLDNVSPDKTHAVLALYSAKVGPKGTTVEGCDVTIDSTVTKLGIYDSGTQIVDDLSVEGIWFKAGHTLTVAEGKTLTADIYTKTEAAAISLTGTSTENSTVGAAFIGTFTYDDATTVHSAEVKIRAGETPVTIAAGSVTVNGTIGKLDGSKIKQISGEVVIGTDESTELTIPAGTTLALYGAVSGYLLNNGTLEVGDGVDLDNIVYDEESTGKEVPVGEDEFNIGGTLDADYRITTSAYLEKNLVVPEGITLYIDGTLKMMDKNLIIKGNLVVGSKGTITTNSDKAIIYLFDTGTITNNGIIGSGSTATVQAATEKSTAEAAYGTVMLQDVKGVGLGIAKNVYDSKVYYILTVSGDVSAVKGGDAFFSAAMVYIGDLEIKDIEAYFTYAMVMKGSTFTIGAKASVDAGSVGLDSGAVMQINGEFTDGEIYLRNGATVIVNGDVTGTDINALTGVYETYDVDGKRQDPEKVIDTYDLVYSSIIADNVKGITITVISKTYLDIDGETSLTEQMLCISGSAVLVDKALLAGAITIDGEDSTATATAGTIYVADALAIPEDIAFVSENDSIVVTTGVLTIIDDDIDFFHGAEFGVAGVDEYGIEYTIWTYTTFDKAYEFIGTCVGNVITLQGGYDFTKTYTIDDDQSVIFLDGDVFDYTIAITGQITVKDGAYLSTGFAKEGIQGILYVEVGGSCIPAADSYTVSSKDADGNMTYTGLAKALEDAEAGDVITLTNSTTVSTLITVPSLVTLKISEGVTLTAAKGLTVNGILVNAGTVNVSGGDLTVNGVYDNTEGTTTVNDAVEATIAGLFTGNLTATTINAATFNNGEYNVYTTPSGAAALVALMDVPVAITVTGKVTDDAEVVLTDGMSMSISGTVKIPSITIMAGAKLTVTDGGKLTTTVIGEVGALIANAPEVDVTEITAVEFKTTYNEATGVYTTTMSAYTAGTAVIDQGSVVFTGSTVTFTKDLVLKVSSGAEMVTTAAVNFSGSYFTMSGFWDMQAGANKLNGMKLAGTTEVAAGASIELTNCTITGEVILDEATSLATEATATVKGYLIMGTAAKDIGADASFAGAITVDTTAYVLVYGTAYFGPEDEELVNTTFTINDELFATVFANKDKIALTGDNKPLYFINKAVLKIEGGYVLPDDFDEVVWYSGTTKVEYTTTAKVGTYSSLTMTLSYQDVAMTFTPEPGTILFIDGVRVYASSTTISVGVHTIAVYLELGYQGDLTVKLNGKVLPVTASGITLDVTPDMQSTTNTLVVSGAEPIPEPEPVTPEEKSEWTVTTILLVILVILIAIMAVIVALRLNRS